MKNFKAACSSFAAVALLALLPCGALADSTMLIATIETSDASGYAQFVKQLTAIQQEAGAKLTATVLHELRRRGGRFGIVSMCVGGGMGAAALFESVS